MKIRNVGQLDSCLASSLSWRKKELTSVKFAIDTAPNVEQKVLLRAGTTLLYAHWEGFVKEAGTYYLEFVSRQKLQLGQLKPNFIAVVVGPQIVLCGRTEKVSIHQCLVEALLSGLAKVPKIKWEGVVKTRSNLKAEVLREIVVTLDLDYTPFELKAKPVVDKLVMARNSIAHGEGTPVSEKDYNDLHAEVIALLDEFKTQVQIAAATGKYRRQ